MVSAPVRQEDLNPRHTGATVSLSLSHSGDDVCFPNLQPERFRQWRPITVHVEQFGSDFTLLGRTKAMPGEPVSADTKHQTGLEVSGI